MCRCWSRRGAIRRIGGVEIDMPPFDLRSPYPRDLIGYGRTPPDPRWPNGARIAVQFVINYEEGGENNILHGDPASEAFLSEIVGAQAWPNRRHMSMESIYEFGSRAGFWRLHRMFTAHNMPVTVFAIATALARNADVVAAMNEAKWEIASHGLKWIDYRDFTEAAERDHVDQALRTLSYVDMAILGRRATAPAPTSSHQARRRLRHNRSRGDAKPCRDTRSLRCDRDCRQP